MKNPSRHHKKPRSLGGSDNQKNISIVPQKQHEAWHILFSNLPGDEVIKQINENWIDPHFKVVSEQELIDFGKRYVNDFELGTRFRRYLFQLNEYRKGNRKELPILE